MEVISQIDNHDFQHIKSNKFEQGNTYSIYKKVHKNKFFSIPTTKKDVGIYVSTLYAQLVPIIENRYIVDLEDYTLNFKKLINNELLKAITSRYNVLKKDLFSFVDEKTYVIPSNKDVIKFFCNLCKCNFIIISPKQKVYNIFSVNEFDKTYVLSQNSQNIFDNLESGLEYVNKKGLYESQILDKMKLSELMTYADKYNIDLKGFKYKQDVINEISKKLI